MEYSTNVLRFWVVMVVVSFVVVGEWEVKKVSGGMSAAQCREEKRIGVIACNNIVFGGSPSAFCCQRIRVSHVECVCPVITKKFAFVDVNHYIRLIQGCGRRVPHHYKCGSITTP